ncbi:MAG: hypothetical protein ACOYVF_12525 [Candidatus Zixiibacteriota bacterium]
MALCPQCKYDYQTGVTVCPECGETLVNILPATGAAAVPPDNSWVRICGLAGGVQSDRAVGALETSNIPTTVISSSFGLFGASRKPAPILSGKRRELNFIMVPREFREEAELILEAVLGEDYLEYDDNV